MCCQSSDNRPAIKEISARFTMHCIYQESRQETCTSETRIFNVTAKCTFVHSISEHFTWEWSQLPLLRLKAVMQDLKSLWRWRFKSRSSVLWHCVKLCLDIDVSYDHDEERSSVFFFRSWYPCSKILRNDGILPQHYTTSQPRRHRHKCSNVSFHRIRTAVWYTHHIHKGRCMISFKRLITNKTSAALRWNIIAGCILLIAPGDCNSWIYLMYSNLERTNLLTPRNGVFLENLIVTQLVNKFPTFYGTWRFITVFTTAQHWPLPWARCIQSTTSYPIFRKIHSNIIIPYTLKSST